MYRDTLQFQIDMKKNKPNLGNMTHVEKKMNKKALHSYKANENAPHSMIPGISNIHSVGTCPTKRKGANFAETRTGTATQL